MATMSEASTALSAGRRGLGRDLAGLAVILVLAGIGYLLFPNNLALLTRITAIALLVLSLDLVTGYCGVATLGHAALFGSGAYAAGIAAVHFGITDPLLMLAAGILGGALAGLACGVVILRAHGLPQLVLSIALIHLFHEFANKASSWTGGSDGLAGISPDPLIGLFAFDLWAARPMSSASCCSQSSSCSCALSCARPSACSAAASGRTPPASGRWARRRRSPSSRCM